MSKHFQHQNKDLISIFQSRLREKLQNESTCRFLNIQFKNYVTKFTTKRKFRIFIKKYMFCVGLFYAYYAGHLLSLYAITIFAVFMLTRIYVKIVFC